MATIRQNDNQAYHTQPIIHNKEALPGGGGGGGPLSLAWIFWILMSVLEIERKFFVFVGILEKGHSDVLWTQETITVQFLS